MIVLTNDVEADAYAQLSIKRLDRVQIVSYYYRLGILDI